MTIVVILIIAALIVASMYAWNNAYYPHKLKMLRKAFERGEYDYVLSIINELPSRRKKETEILWIQAQVYYNQSQYVMAMVILNELIATGTFTKEMSAVVLHRMLAHIYEATNKYKKAMEEYEEIAKLEPENFEANFKIGGFYYEARDYNDARNYLERAARIDDSKPELLYMLAVIYLDREELQSALAMVESCLAADETNGNARLLRGKILYYLKRFDESRGDLLVSYNMSETKMESALYLGYIAEEIGDLDNALVFFEDGLVLNTRSDDETMRARAGYAELLVRVKRFSDALDQWRMMKHARAGGSEVDDKIQTYSRILSRPPLLEALKTEIETYMDKTLYKVLAKNGYAIVESRKASESRIFFLTIKKIGGGVQSYRSAFMFDTSCRALSSEDAQGLIAYFKDKKAHNAFVISIGGFQPSFSASAGDTQVETMDADKLEAIIQGSVTF